MLKYPTFDPVAFQIGFLKVHWYGLMYLCAFLLGWLLLRYRAHKSIYPLKPAQVGDLILFCAMGVLLGGRIGYMLFYDLSNFLQHPQIIFYIQQGGMSFHGGLLGVLVALWLYSRKISVAVWDVIDFLVPVVPLGLALGRFGNFINAELWGRITTVPWGMVFPNAGPLPRHPSQLYELLLEGVALFVLLWIFSAKPRPRFAVSAVFLVGYGVARFICEFFRQPDPQMGYLAFGWLTMGQLLSLPMIIVGFLGLLWIYQGKSGKKRSRIE